MFKCIDKTELAQKITGVLIYTQFAAWIEPEPKCIASEQAIAREKRAIDYYLGHPKNDKPSVEQLLAYNKFHHVVDTQTAMIMRCIEVKGEEDPYG
ncbi:hypothetical protein LCGC14_1743770 [marine sediment metagenome]|uniref:Uncharacterized protein n=1 Tax=marine sediment metagenome TaxID=412755 RepID=A0A0F9H5Y0_9ZZZZ